MKEKEIRIQDKKKTEEIRRLKEDYLAEAKRDNIIDQEQYDFFIKIADYL